MSGFMTDLFAEHAAPVGYIAPQSSNGATLLSQAIAMKNVYRLAAVINIGTIASTGTVDIKFTQAVTSGGTYKDVSGKALTQLTNADSAPKPLVVELRADELDIVNGYKFVKLSLTTATAASLVSAVVFALSDYLPIDQTLWKQALV